MMPALRNIADKDEHVHAPNIDRVDYSKAFGREGQGSCRNTTGTIFDLHGPPGGSFMHICNDPHTGTVENAASVPIWPSLQGRKQPKFNLLSLICTKFVAALAASCIDLLVCCTAHPLRTLLALLVVTKCPCT